MAGRNCFRSLKNHGEKIVKFKQRRYIEELSSVENNDSTLAAIYERVKSGVCTALAIDWIATRSKSSQTNYHTNNHDYNKFITRYAAYIQDCYINKLRDSVPSVSQRMALMAKKQYGLNLEKYMVPIDRSSGQSIPRFVDALKKIQLFTTYLMVFQMNIGQKKVSHATGIERGPGMLYFFDPSIGEYKVSKSNFIGFFTEYFNLKANHWGGNNLIISLYSSNKLTTKEFVKENQL